MVARLLDADNLQTDQAASSYLQTLGGVSMFEEHRAIFILQWSNALLQTGSDFCEHTKIVKEAALYSISEVLCSAVKGMCEG